VKQLVVCGSFPFTSQTFVTREVASAHKAGHEVHVLAPTTGDAMGEEFCRQLGFPLDRVIYRNYARKPVFSADPRRFTAKIAEAAMCNIYGFVLGERRKTFFCELIKDPRIRNAEVIHAHFMGWGHMVAVPLARILGIPVTVGAHEVELPDVDPEHLRYVQKYADAVTVNSTEYIRHWSKLTGSEDKLRLVYQGVDLAEFGDSSQRGLSGRIKLVSVARLVPHKRVADGIKAMRKLLDRGIDAEYRIVSDGPERTRLEALRDELGVGDRVHFLGFLTREGLLAELMASDVLLHPSEAEGFGIAVIEGMAAGLPVVVAAYGGAEDIVAHGRNGYLHKIGDVDALAEYVAQLASDPAKRKLVGLAARATVESRFSWQSHMSEMYSVWDEAVASHQRKTR
jgi:glycosyltransferase involved in cell wall biosynthesis